MKRLALAASVVLAVLMMVILSAGTAEGGYRGSRASISGGGVSFSFGGPHSYGFSHVDGYPWRGRHYGRHGGTSLFFSFGTGPRYSYSDRGYYRRPYYRRYRYRDDGSGYGYYPYRGRRMWVPGGMYGGRYRSGYWEYRDDGRHYEHRDRKDGHRGGRRGRY